MAAEDPAGIDLDDVLRRARRRRRPRLIAAIAGGALAIGAIATPVVAISLPSARLAASAGSAGSAASAPDAAAAGGAGARSGNASPERLQRCGAPLASAPSPSGGLVLTVTPLTAPAGSARIPVEVALTNTGTAPVDGSTPANATVVLSRDGVVLWHSNGPTTLVAVPVALAPGASTTLRATLDPVVCGPEDETGAEFRTGLPAAGAGAYQVTAAVEFLPADGGRPVFVTSAPATLTLTAG